MMSSMHDVKLASGYSK